MEEKIRAGSARRRPGAAHAPQRSRDPGHRGLAYLEAGGGIGQIEVAGSYPRRRETIGDLDIVVTSEGKDSAT